MSSASAAQTRIRAWLDKTSYNVGDPMVLRIVEDLAGGGHIRVADSTGATWTRLSRTSSRQVWAATAGPAGPGTVRVEGTGASGRRFVAEVSYQVVAATPDPAATDPDPTDPAPPSPGTGQVLIGMSAPSTSWDQRVAEVGPGVAARRIFADLAAGATSQIKSVEAAHRAGLMPLISYKVGGDISGAISGNFDMVAEQAAARLASYGLPTAVTFWHEPNPDITGAQFVALHRRMLPIFQGGQVTFGPILNGWLLDNQRALFEQYLAADLLTAWDWVGMDVYQAGSETAPKRPYPSDRIAPLLDLLADRGVPDKPIVIGEYNGWTAAAVAESGEVFLSTPSLWVACVFNSDVGNKGRILEGDRLIAFQQTLADPRSADPLLT